MINYGILFRFGSCWIGFHWSTDCKRLCVNLIPFLTFWISFPGGKAPSCEHDLMRGNISL